MHLVDIGADVWHLFQDEYPSTWGWFCRIVNERNWLLYYHRLPKLHWPKLTNMELSPKYKSQFNNPTKLLQAYELAKIYVGHNHNLKSRFPIPNKRSTSCNTPSIQQTFDKFPTTTNNTIPKVTSCDNVTVTLKIFSTEINSLKINQSIFNTIRNNKIDSPHQLDQK